MIMNSYEKKMREYISTQLPNSCEMMKSNEAIKTRERKNEIAKEKERLLLDNQIIMRSIKKDKRKMEKEVNYVVNKRLKFNEVEKIYTLLSNKVKMDPSAFMEEYKTLISPYFWWEEQTHSPNEICNYLYAAISKRMNEESQKFSMWEE